MQAQEVQEMQYAISKERRAFHKAGRVAVSDANLNYAVWLRGEIEVNQALLALLHKGEVEVQGEGEDALISLAKTKSD